jgi:mono/diheme cytochrome c family protein
MVGSLGKIAVVLVFVGGVGVVALNAIKGQQKVEVAVVEPASPSPLAIDGKRLFEANCAACHGARAGGTEQGPPFVSDIYNPGYHADEAFILAARYGVRAHHWRFGNMPPVQGIADSDVRAIVKYVREVQEANGIAFRPHAM